MLGTGLAELAEGDGVAAGFGEEVAAVAEHVCPLPEPWFAGRVPAAELPEFERPDHTVLTTSDAWETDIESQGHDPTHQDLQMERITPPESIAARLNLDPRSDTVVVRRHVRYIDGKPAIISDDYFDERIVECTELAEPEDTTRENILAEAGYEQIYDIDEIITRMPTPAEVQRLGISTGTPVAEHIRTGYTAENRPVRVMVSIIPGDTLILQYTIPT